MSTPLLICKIDFGTPEYDEAVRLRYQVLREPLGLDYTAEQLAEEYSDHHLGLYLPSGTLGACLTFTPSSVFSWKMRQVAVSPYAQGQGLGTQLIIAAESYAKTMGVAHMHLSARITAVSFYQKLFYTPIGGLFEEIGLDHQRFEKQL
jgi:GNAT superfamily N-acetyltransferase